MFRYVHLSIIYSGPLNDPRKLDTTVNFLARDWIRYATNNWVLWIDKPLSVVTYSIRPILDRMDNALAISMNPHEIPAGQMPQWVWDWFNRYRDPQTGNVDWPPPLPVPPVPPAIGGALSMPPVDWSKIVKSGLGGPDPSKKG